MSEFEEWYIKEVDGDDGIFGPGFCSCSKLGYHLECQERFREVLKEQEYIKSLYDEYEYKPVKYEGNKLFQEAESAILEYLKFDPCENGYSKEQVLENEDSFYFPIGWIGCSGHLVLKDSLKIIGFGSYIGPYEHIWAYYQGIKLDNLGKDRRNKFTLLEVNNEVETLLVLKRFLDSKYVSEEVAPNLSELPITFKEVDLYFSIRDILTAKYNNWFKFEIE